MKFTFILCAVLVSLTIKAQVEENNTIETCRLIKNNNERLLCYDEIDTLINKPQNNLEPAKENLSQINPQASFPVLLADLEEPRIFASLGQLDFLDNQINSILLGVGTRLKMKSFNFKDSEKPINFNFITLIKSQFDVDEIDTRNNRGGALINTDFMFGGELVKPFDSGYLRLRYSHKSTHLGDEFLIDNPEFIKERINLSYETVDLLAYRNMNRWGGYFGSSAIVRSEPGDLDNFQLQSGLQYKGIEHTWFTPIFAIDFKSWQASNWHLNTSIKAGLEYSGFLDHPLHFMLEYYEGKSPYGQFYTEDLKFLGFSVNHYWQ
jgi:hypothetical protein